MQRPQQKTVFERDCHHLFDKKECAKVKPRYTPTQKQENHYTENQIADDKSVGGLRSLCDFLVKEYNNREFRQRCQLPKFYPVPEVQSILAQFEQYHQDYSKNFLLSSGLEQVKYRIDLVNASVRLSFFTERLQQFANSALEEWFKKRIHEVCIKTLKVLEANFKVQESAVKKMSVCQDSNQHCDDKKTDASGRNTSGIKNTASKLQLKKEEHHNLVILLNLVKSNLDFAQKQLLQYQTQICAMCKKAPPRKKMKYK